MSTQTAQIDGPFVPYERTVQIVINTPYSTEGIPNYTLNVARELRYLDANNNSLSGESPVNVQGYLWDFSSIKDKTVTSDGLTLTIAQLANFIRDCADQLVQTKKTEMLLTSENVTKE